MASFSRNPSGMNEGRSVRGDDRGEKKGWTSLKKKLANLKRGSKGPALASLKSDF